MSVTATAVIASTILGAESADAATYKVKSGDTLWSISQQHSTSIGQLKSWNNLTNDIIFPNQVLEVGGSNATNNKNTEQTKSNSSSSKANTYTVKSGDSLSKIAHAHGISLKNLMDWNNLSTTLIYPGDKLTVSKKASSSNTGSSSSNNNNNSSSSSKSTYTVKSGDTLGHIASAHGISLNNLMKWNNLNSHMIYPGEKLVLKEGAAPPKKDNSSPGNSSAPASGDLISVAKSMIGTPYVWGGASPSGFDCSGFIHWAFKESGNDMGRLSTDGYYNRSYMIDSPQVGDLVFFEGTYRSGISHMGIYLGNNQFIHAGSSTGVTIANLNNSYWSKHFHSFKRFY